MSTHDGEVWLSPGEEADGVDVGVDPGAPSGDTTVMGVRMDDGRLGVTWEPPADLEEVIPPTLRGDG